ncbi:MAG: TIGR02266 family protein [Kofleriaceae bacterium]
MVESNTRQAKRTPVTLKVKFKSQTLEQFIERYAVDVSQGGIFIRTKDPQAVGTQMKFEFQLRDGAPLIGGEGTVVWIREFDPARPAIAPGMGVRFDRLADGSVAVLEQILNQKSRLSNPRGAPSRPPSFNETPTRVAQAPMTDEERENTPLPSPIPFHSDADEFPDEAFEEATKVRLFEELVAQTALGSFELPLPAPAGSSPHLSPPSDAGASSPFDDAPGLHPFDPPAATPPFANAREEHEAPATRTLLDAAPPPVAAHAARALSDTGQSRTLLGTAAPVTAPSLHQSSPQLPLEPPRPAPRARESSRPPATAAPLPSDRMPPPQQAAVPRSRVSLLVVALLCVLVAAIALVWLLWVKQPDQAGPVVTTPPTAPATNPPTGAEAGSAVEPPPPPPKTAETTIVAEYPGAKIEVLAADQSGASPFVAKLVEGQRYDVRVSAPTFISSELTVIGGNDPRIAVKLDPKPRALEIKSNPPAAAIFVDNSSTKQVTPATIDLTTAQAGKRLRVIVRRAGFAAQATTIKPEDFTEEPDRMVFVIDAQLARAVIAPPKAQPEPSTEPAGEEPSEPPAEEPKEVAPKPAEDPPAPAPAPASEPAPDWSK